MLACPNPRCRGGGFELEFTVESMVRERLTERVGLMVCVGWERAEGRRKGEAPCTKAISYRIRLRYRGPVGQATRQEINGRGEAL
jgi:hypothetical protein